MVSKTKVRIKGPNNNLGVVPILVEWGIVMLDNLVRMITIQKNQTYHFTF